RADRPPSPTATSSALSPCASLRVAKVHETRPSDGRPTVSLVSGTSRNAQCPCGSGRKYKRCCADALEHPARVAMSHDAVGERIRAWAFEHHNHAIDAALAELVAGREDLVLGDGDIAVIATWTLSDRELPEGDTLAER